MPKFTSAYSGFLTRLEEVDALYKLARAVARRRHSEVHVSTMNALCRAGVVMLSGHVEGYIEDLGELALERIFVRKVAKNKLGDSFRYYLSRPLVLEMKETSDPTKIAEKIDTLLRDANDVWSTNATFSKPLPVDHFIGDFSNPTHKRIRKFFNRFGYKSYLSDLAGSLAADFDPCRNMIDQVVAQRNRIAHGDTTATGTPSELADMIRLAKKFCRETDTVVGNWFRDLGCPIR